MRLNHSQQSQHDDDVQGSFLQEKSNKQRLQWFLFLVPLVTEGRRYQTIATVKCVARVQHKREYQQEQCSGESQTLSLISHTALLPLCHDIQGQCQYLMHAMGIYWILSCSFLYKCTRSRNTLQVQKSIRCLICFVIHYFDVCEGVWYIFKWTFVMRIYMIIITIIIIDSYTAQNLVTFWLINALVQ